MAAMIVVILVLVVVGIVIKHLFFGGSRVRHSTSVKQQSKVKSQTKVNKPVKKQAGRNLTSKAKSKKSSVVSDTAAVLAGAAVHQLRNHHKHDDISDIDDNRSDIWDDEFDDLYDDDFYDDLDSQDYKDSYYEYERTAYEEEQAAYDDFIASMDMDND